MANIHDVANWFLSKESMSPKKVQKLTYYYYAWGHALYEKPMIEKCNFEAWIHGPVNTELYFEYKIYKWNDIPMFNDKVYDFNEEEKELLESVWLTYGEKSANELEALSHTELPWKNARLGLKDNEPSDRVINTEDMKNYYYSIYSEEQGD